MQAIVSSWGPNLPPLCGTQDNFQDCCQPPHWTPPTEGRCPWLTRLHWAHGCGDKEPCPTKYSKSHQHFRVSSGWLTSVWYLLEKGITTGPATVWGGTITPTTQSRHGPDVWGHQAGADAGDKCPIQGRSPEWSSPEEMCSQVHAWVKCTVVFFLITRCEHLSFGVPYYNVIIFYSATVSPCSQTTDCLTRHVLIKSENYCLFDGGARWACSPINFHLGQITCQIISTETRCSSEYMNISELTNIVKYEKHCRGTDVLTLPIKRESASVQCVFMITLKLLSV